MPSRSAVLLVALLALPIASAASLTAPGRSQVEPGTVTCTAEAPGATSCTTGTHVGVNLLVQPVGLGHNALAGPGYTGTVGSRLRWLPAEMVEKLGFGERVYRCDFVNGYLQGCTATGQFPPPGPYVIEHHCQSSTFRTTAPGGSGPWGCSFTRAAVNV